MSGPLMALCPLVMVAAGIAWALTRLPGARAGRGSRGWLADRPVCPLPSSQAQPADDEHQQKDTATNA